MVHGATIRFAVVFARGIDAFFFGFVSAHIGNERNEGNSGTWAKQDSDGGAQQDPTTSFAAAATVAKGRSRGRDAEGADLVRAV